MAIRIGWLKRLEEKWPDYDLDHVPKEARKPWYTNTFLWCAWTAILAPSLAGAAMAGGMTIGKTVACIFIANVIIAVISVIMGFIGQRVGLGTGQLARYALGTKGAKITAFLAGCLMFFWAMLDMTMAGQLGIGVLNGNWGHFIPVIIILAVTGYAVLRGISGPAWIAYIAVPIVIVIYTITVVVAIQQGGGWSALGNYVPENPMPMSLGIMLALAAWITGAVMAPDLVRVAKDKKGVWLGPPVGLLVIESTNLFIGAVGFILLKTFGLSETVVALGGGWGILAIIGCFIMFLKTNPTTTYSSSLNFAAVFGKPKHRFVLIVVPLLLVMSTIVAFVSGLQTVIVNGLPWVAATMMAVAGTIAADYWLVARGRYPQVTSLTQTWNWVGILSFVVGTAVNMVVYWLTNSGRVSGWSAGIPGVDGFVVAALVHYLLSIARPTRYPSLAEAETVPSLPSIRPAAVRRVEQAAVPHSDSPGD